MGKKWIYNAALFKNPSDILVSQNNWHLKSVEVAKLPQGNALLLLQSRDAE